MIDITNYMNTPPEADFDLDLRQSEVDGGVISYEQIDTINDYPDAKSIVISGLKQDTFSYFIQKYGNRFEAISFWKNKSVEDLTLLGTLNNIKYINWFFNQRATSLWDMSDNDSLLGLGIYDFSRLHDISQIGTSKSLRSLCLGDMVWAGMVIPSFKPILNTGITHFEWCGKCVEDNDYLCLSQSNIEVLDINPTRFTLEELTDLLAGFPESLKGTITKPYVTSGIKDKDGYRQYYFLCKNKRKCLKGQDDERFQKYLEEFEEMLKSKRME